ISATERPSAMRAQNRSAHSVAYFVGRPILAGTCFEWVLVRGGIFEYPLLGGHSGNAAAFAQAMTEAALSLFSVSKRCVAAFISESMLLFWAAKIVLQHSTGPATKNDGPRDYVELYPRRDELLSLKVL